MYMFRRKRNSLAKRLLKARKRHYETRSKEETDHGTASAAATAATASDEDGSNCGAWCGSLSDEGLLRNGVLKRLKDNQLEMLVEAVESGGAGSSACVLVSTELMAQPHVLCCQLWRWPELASSDDLRKTPDCTSNGDPVYVCCNPYHWSRLCEPESPPPPYSRFNNERLKPEDRAPSEKNPNIMECDYMYRSARHHQSVQKPSYYQTDKFVGSFSTSGENESKENEWCKLAYWELSQRVGRMFPVQNTAVNVFWTNMRTDGLSLETLAHHSFPPPDSVYKNRNKIGLGITLSQENDGIWIYNRSDWPVFVNSPTLDRPRGRALSVYRVPAGHCFRIFCPILAGPSSSYWDAGWPGSGPINPNSVRISFGKGWGPKYHRQEITACPTWLEVLLSPCR